MRSRRQLATGLLLPAFLVGLVAVFATLQYRWLGQASEADREQMRRAINERAQAFAEEFDREVVTAAASLAADGGIDADDAGAMMAARLVQWRTAARFPDLVRHVYVSVIAAGETSLHRYAEKRSRFEAVPWPASLDGVRQRLTSRDGPMANALLPAILPVSVVAEVPALIIPTRASTPHFTIVELDAEVLGRDVLPALAGSHFPGEGPDAYRIAVRDAAGATMFSAGRTADLRDAASADASATLLQVRPEALLNRDVIEWRAGTRMPDRVPLVVQGLTAALPREGRGARGSDPPGPRIVMQVDRLGTRIRVQAPDRWTLLVQHPAGSIDAAVHAGRRRNLWVSFGLLAVLAAGVALVVVNAQRAEQLAGKQMEFVATVSHELRTPVAVMRSAAQNLSAGVVSDPDRARRYGELIEEEGRRLTEMVEQVLEFAGGPSPRSAAEAQVVDAGRIARESLESYRPLLEAEGFDIEGDIAGTDTGLPAVHGDPQALRRAIGNLLANALKHGAGGRWIRVDVRAVQSGPATGGVAITVSDRGPGIDPSDLPHVFEPFYRGVRAVEQQVQGSGLGLSLVERIVEAHGGRVSVTSPPGAGATFTIHLPA